MITKEISLRPTKESRLAGLSGWGLRRRAPRGRAGLAELTRASQVLHESFWGVPLSPLGAGEAEEEPKGEGGGCLPSGPTVLLSDSCDNVKSPRPASDTVSVK